MLETEGKVIRKLDIRSGMRILARVARRLLVVQARFEATRLGHDVLRSAYELVSPVVKRAVPKARSALQHTVGWRDRELRTGRARVPT